MTDLFTIKYKPVDFNTYLGQEQVVKKIIAYVKNRALPHMIFFGKWGIGKTTLVDVLKNELFKGLPQYAIERNFAMIDASSQEGSGIDSIQKFINFCNVAPVLFPFKLYVFEEADKLTPKAKTSLKVMLGEGEGNISEFVRVIFVTNDISRIDDSMRSSKGGRCEEHMFRPVSLKLIAQRLWYINKKENFNSSKEDIIKIAKLADGSPRSALRIYQSFILSGEIHNIEELEYSASPNLMINYALNGNIVEANKILTQILYTDGINGYNLFRDISSLIRKTGIKGQHSSNVGKILESLYHYQQAIVSGCSTETVVGSFLGNLSDIGYSNKVLIEGLKANREGKSE